MPKMYRKVTNDEYFMRRMVSTDPQQEVFPISCLVGCAFWGVVLLCLAAWGVFG